MCCILILLKHEIDCCAKLNSILLVDIAGVYLEVLQSISSSLLRAELYLLPLSLALCYASFCILKANFLLSPSVRKYCIGKDIAASRFAKDNLAIGFLLQVAYKSYSGGLQAISGLAQLVQLVWHISVRSAIERSTEWNQILKDWIVRRLYRGGGLKHCLQGSIVAQASQPLA